MNHSPEVLDNLVIRAVTGDPSSLESLLMHFHDHLLRGIQQAMASRPSCGMTPEDVLQETFMGAFRNVHALEPRGHHAFLKWLKTIADTRMTNMIRAAGAQKRGGGRQPVARRAHSDSTEESILRQLPGLDLTPSRIVRKKETLAAITQLLAELDPLRRQIMTLRYGQGCTLDEIAERIGKREGAVKMLLNRTLKELREKMAAGFGEFSLGA